MFCGKELAQIMKNFAHTWKPLLKFPAHVTENSFKNGPRSNNTTMCEAHLQYVIAPSKDSKAKLALATQLDFTKRFGSNSAALLSGNISTG